MTAWPVRLDEAATRELIARACPDSVDSSFQDAPGTLVRAIPRWVGAFGVVTARDEHWLWIAPADARDRRADAPDADSDPLVMDLPPGRYLVDAFDTGTQEWISRESCLAAPLVAALPHRRGPVVLRIRFIHAAAPDPPSAR